MDPRVQEAGGGGRRDAAVGVLRGRIGGGRSGATPSAAGVIVGPLPAISERAPQGGGVGRTEDLERKRRLAAELIVNVRPEEMEEEEEEEASLETKWFLRWTLIEDERRFGSRDKVEIQLCIFCVRVVITFHLMQNRFFMM